MKYCPYCGSVNNNINGNFCENCGAVLKGYNVSNNSVNYSNNNTYIPEGNTLGWGLLGFFIPIVGLILFIIWNKEKPKSARSAGIGALIRVIITVITIIVLMIALIVIEPDYSDRKPFTNPYESRERYNEDSWT